MGRKSLRCNEGYTLIEIMTVVAILGILAMFAFPSVKRMQNSMSTKASATQVAGLLSNARERALAEGTPHLVYFNTADAPAAGDTGGCPPIAVEVRDADHSYSITPGDTTSEFRLPSDACGTVKQYDGATGEESALAEVPLPADDLTKRAADVAAAVTSDDPNAAASNSGKGNANGTATAPGQLKKVADATVAETVVNGTTFPVDATDGRPVVAFSERGVPVDPSSPNDWGTGAGGLYLTDGESTVVAAIVGALGDVELRVFDPASGSWR